jgi:hypothetical protein
MILSFTETTILMRLDAVSVVVLTLLETSNLYLTDEEENAGSYREFSSLLK